MKVLEKNGQVIEGNFDNKEVKEAFWHTSAHVLAQAVKRLYPDTKCAIGPAIDNGFYYDFDFSFPFTEENLAAIEKEMKKIVKQSLPLEVFEVKKEEALSYMKERQEDYKVEMIEELPEDETITFYKQGDYEEFCAGPHVSNTCVIKAIKLLSTAGAYWRGDEKNKMLTRIYGISFPKASELKDYLNMLEEAKKRDHRKLGKELGLFTIMEEGPGFPFFLPKGMVLKNTLIDYWRKIHTREEYQEICQGCSDYDLPVHVEGLIPEEVLSATKKDKKMEQGHIRFILMDGIGKSFIDKTVTDEELLSCIQEITLSSENVF